MDLIEAAKNGSLQEVKDVIASTTIPLDCQWLDYTALNNSIAYGHLIVAEYLLSMGCRVNMDKEADIPDNTPLHNAVILENVDLIESLLEKDACILAINGDGNSSLHLAFLLRNDSITDLLLDTLQKTNNLSNVKNHQGLSHMHIACTRKYSKVVESFIAMGVDLNDCVDQDSFLWSGFTALHFAVEYKSVYAVEAILSSSAPTNLSIEDAFYGLTPLNLVLHQLENLSTIAKLLLDKRAESKDSIIKETKEIIAKKEIIEKREIEQSSTTGLSEFHMACMENNPNIVEHFIANGASVHQPVISHIDLFHLYTPLHLAVENKCKSTVEILLKNGADVNLQNNDKMTPLHLAFYVNDHDDKQDIIDYLYAAVESKLANPKDANGLSYLHVACTRNDLKTVTYLLDIGEDVNAQVQRNSRNVPNFTPLHFAVEYQHVEIVKLLIERGANVNRYSLQGTPLHLACECGHAELVDLLLDNGAKVDESMRLHSLIDAYMSCQKNPLLSCVERLVSLGVDVDAKDSRGNTALHRFCSWSNKNDSCARFLLDLGANVNLENDEGRTAFDIRDNSVELYNHVQDLKALGVEVNPKNDECCSRMLSSGFVEEETHERNRQQRIDEITCMKSIKLSKQVSLDDFLRLDACDTMAYVSNDILKLVVTTNDLIKCFPTYAYLIKLQYCRAVGSFGVKGKKDRDTEVKRRRLR